MALLDDGQRKLALAAWLQELETGFADRILPISAPIAVLWGRATAIMRRRGVAVSVEDGLFIADAKTEISLRRLKERLNGAVS
ncbi:MAG: type II toxin-antitoxin system VapC family toxin [Myxococcales bacterium]|nr:type II toxin-antitoxin system VapC family toxin [Myxococcales bacterium]